MSADRLEADIRERGFAVVGRLVDHATAALMRERLAAAIEADLQRWSGNPYYRDHWMVHNLMLRDPVFLEFLDQPRLHAWLDRLLSPSSIVYAYTSSSLPPHGSNYSRRIHVDAQARCGDTITNVGVMLALDDFSPANGATLFMPGSQRLDQPPAEEAFMAAAEMVLPRIGEAVVFNARTYHLGGLNSTGQPRHAITLNACRHWMKQRFDYPRMLDPAQVERLGARGQALLGMHSRVPESLEQYYVAPEQRLYRAGQD